MARPWQPTSRLESKVRGSQLVMYPSDLPGVEYCVDNVDGLDTNTGYDWDNAFKTVQAAITASNATVDWSYTPKKYNRIYVKPGVYAENLTPAYYCHIIGLGIPGTDTQAEIHPTTGSCLTGTLLGAGLQNLWFEVNEALACLDIGIGNNSYIGDCVFTNGDAVAAWGIDTDTATHLTIERCRFESGQTTGLAYGIYARGGADKYWHCCVVRDCYINASTAGIWIQNTCTASGAMIGPGNVIVGAAKGIDDNSGTTYCVGNFISATDAIEHANSTTMCVGNSVTNNGTGAKETANS